MESRQDRLQRHRLQMTLLSVVNSLLQSMIIALYAWSGATSWTTAAEFALASVATTGLFALAVARGWILGMSDARLLHAQLGVNFLVQVAFMVVAPKLWVIFLASTLVTCSYAMVAFTPRQFTWLWLGYGATTAIALFVGRDRFGSPAPTYANIAILWLFFFLGVRRLALTGAQFTRLREQLSEKNKQLTVLLERNRELASRDELTGAFNRRHLIQLLAEERERAGRTGQPFAVALFDLDHFKSVNDAFGHAAGDAVLRHFCSAAHDTMRTTDRFARYGGEEFVLLMPVGTDAAAAALATERICTSIALQDWKAVLGGHDHAVTVSAGIATWRVGETLESVLARADVALYEAKERGRNQWVIASDAGAMAVAEAG